MTTVNAEIEKRFLDVFKKITHRHQPWKVWSDFILFSACAISNAVDKKNFEIREAEYMSNIAKYTTEEARLFGHLLDITVESLDRNPQQDWLGHLFMSLNLSDHWKGQFFTPYSIAKMMAIINSQGTKELVQQKGYISVNDCAVGAGCMLIAYANYCTEQKINYQQHVHFYAQDIDRTAALMTYIQLSLLGCCAEIKVGNTLKAEEVSAENIWYTPMYYHETWKTRRMIKLLQNLFSSKKSSNEIEQKDTSVPGASQHIGIEDLLSTEISVEVNSNSKIEIDISEWKQLELF